MNINITSFILLIILSLLMTPHLLAQDELDNITEIEKKTVIHSISILLSKHYVFPKMANKINDYLSSQLKNGEYKSMNDPNDFANQLTTDLRKISNDLHLRVAFDPNGIRKARKANMSKPDSIKLVNTRIKELKKNNFGFKELKILEGNIGYLNLTSFENTTYAGNTAISAMNFLSNSDAIIIDIRNNVGGEPSMIQLITSYFFSAERTIHLNDFYWRNNEKITSTYTLPYIPGNRFPDKDIFILTSGTTFSAGEEFSYNLKHLNRATIIGERTGGAAHPGEIRIATSRYKVWIPNGRSINPITNTNWEGVGVIPHIETKENVFLVAQYEALKSLKSKQKTNDSNNYDWYLENLNSIINPLLIKKEILKSYIGTYGPRKITFEKDACYYQRGNGTKHKLIPIENDLFQIKEINEFRLKFVTSGKKVKSIKGLYIGGHEDENLKIN